MGRVRREILIGERKAWALFDTGARNTYITRDAASCLSLQPLPAPARAALGGRVHRIDTACFLAASVEGRPVWGDAAVVDDIGTDEDGRPIEVLFGALLMQKWGVRVHPDTQSLDLTHYPEEFVEFLAP